MTQFSEHFTIAELACPTTGIIKLQDGFIDTLEEFRFEYAKPMVVVSGGRSKIHNQGLIQRGLPASEFSLHLIENEKYGTDTCAVDIAKPNIFDQARMISIALFRGWTVRVGKSFIHFDRRIDCTDLKQHFDTY